MARLVVRMQMPPGLETGGRDDEETEEYVHDHDDYDDDDYDPDEMLDNYMHEYVSLGWGWGPRAMLLVVVPTIVTDI